MIFTQSEYATVFTDKNKCKQPIKKEEKGMPTFNQLVRKGRQTSVKKSTAPALQKGFNSLHKKSTDISSEEKRSLYSC